MHYTSYNTFITMQLHHTQGSYRRQTVPVSADRLQPHNKATLNHTISCTPHLSNTFYPLCHPQRLFNTRSAEAPRSYQTYAQSTPALAYSLWMIPAHGLTIQKLFLH
ncbi:hypothetical protein BaRGS_00034641 [Batillaria attramentaria]|uniref:Uncharacterized protein n=1 Tax=Batillaria attramentaria TaxID=370345 RepID=A0ABD0JGN6_9CAEN